MTAERAHAGTEWQAALPRMEASGGFQMQPLPLTCMFIVAPGYPSLGLPGPYITVSLAAKSSSTEAPGKGQAAKASKVIKGERQLHWGPRDWGLAPVLPPLQLLASLRPPKGQFPVSQEAGLHLPTSYMRNAVMAAHFAYLYFVLLLLLSRFSRVQLCAIP